MTYKLRVLCFGKVLDFITKKKKIKKSSDIFGNLFHIGIDFSVIDNKSRWDFFVCYNKCFFFFYCIPKDTSLLQRDFFFCLLDAVKNQMGQ